MKGSMPTLLTIVMFFLMLLTSCFKDQRSDRQVTQGQVLIDTQAATQAPHVAKPITYSGQIYLYGESHGVAKILDAEFKLWHDYYQNKGMRHLFVELPYYTAELLNIWMQSNDDDILNKLYDDWINSATHNPDSLEFYKNIKSKCNKTIFHGTDVGHQYDTTGQRFLKYLEDNNLREAEQYQLTQEAISQGKSYYQTRNDSYRENMMVENFIRELEKLGSADVMGIYGSAHTGLDALDFGNSVPCMANKLKTSYGSAVHSEDLRMLEKQVDPIRVDKIKVGEIEYVASYFGKQDITWSTHFISREFWRLEGTYEAFKYKRKTGDVLPYNNYPMLIEIGQVFVIDYTKMDGSVIRTYCRSDGNLWQGMSTTEEFKIHD